jgi:hypothetical protein
VAEPRADAGPRRADANHDQHAGAQDPERHAKGASREHGSDTHQPDRRVQQVDERDGPSHREPDEERATAAEDAAHDQQRHGSDLCSEDAEPDTRQEEAGQH